LKILRNRFILTLIIAFSFVIMASLSGCRQERSVVIWEWMTESEAFCTISIPEMRSQNL